MLIIYSIVFGIVQGLTEFLPVSSSGHLLLLHDLFNLGLADSFSFDVALHWGTFLSLVLFFWPDIIRLIKAFFSSFRKWNLKNNLEQRLAWMILVGSLPVIIVGYFADEALNEVFRSTFTVAFLLIVFGLLFLFYEKLGLKSSTLNELSFGSAIKIGIAQIFALIPGVSRSGVSIIAGLGENLKREDAARFSFLLSLPAVFGAGVKKFYDLRQIGLPQNEITAFIVGILVSAAVGYFCVKYLLKYLSAHPLNIFAYYRIVLGLAVLLFLWLAK